MKRERSSFAPLLKKPDYQRIVKRRSFLGRFFVFVIKIYQRLISPLFPSKCRFYPTCSHYTIEAIEKYGPSKGLLLGAKRISRCHPFNPGGYDPVP